MTTEYNGLAEHSWIVTLTLRIKNRTQEQVWQDMSNRFNLAMNFETAEDVKNGTQLKDFVTLACGNLNILIEG